MELIVNSSKSINAVTHTYSSESELSIDVWHWGVNFELKYRFENWKKMKSNT